MAEIDPSNIVGRRTRGKKIDYAKEAELAGKELEDDEDDDEEYVLIKDDLPELTLFRRLLLPRPNNSTCAILLSWCPNRSRKLSNLAYIDNFKSCYKSVC